MTIPYQAARTPSGREVPRRAFLRAAGALALAPPLAACGRQGRHPLERPELTLLSRRPANGEAEGLGSLLTLYQQYYPGVSVGHVSVPAGPGGRYKAMLRNRLLGSDPPDTFQVSGGSALLDTWVRNRYLEPITDLWRVERWAEVFPRPLRDLVSLGDEIYAVPANAHRANLLWYHCRLFDRYDLQPPTTLAEFFTVADRLRARGVVPLAQASQERWEVPHLFECLLLGTAGAAFYQDLFAGRAAWTDERVHEALDRLDRVLGYANPDHATLTWDRAAGRLGRGEAAMTVMGDWVKGYLVAQGWQAVVEFDAVPAFETSDQFIIVTDAFGLPRGTAGRAVTIAFLRLLGSAEGQDAFNPKQGSIPARSDVRDAARRAASAGQPTRYDPIALRTMDDFEHAELLLSSAHGAASSESFTEAIEHALSGYLEQRDPGATMRRLERLAQSLGIRA
jgi:glucose/mannose transport system substrate-binding protein